MDLTELGSLTMELIDKIEEDYGENSEVRAEAAMVVVILETEPGSGLYHTRIRYTDPSHANILTKEVLRHGLSHGLI